MAQSGIYFFIGTEAELIKLFPVMLQLQAQQVPYHIIASGQNDIVKAPFCAPSTAAMWIWS